MTDKVSHRGPDDFGYFREGPVGLGHRRLSIIDLGGGKQRLVKTGGRPVLTFEPGYQFGSLVPVHDHSKLDG